MRPKVIAAILGLVLTVGGVGGLAYGVVRLSSTPASTDCVGDECLADPSVLFLPIGIVAMVFGLIIASWALGSIRSDRPSQSPLRAFGFMTGLGGVFLAMGVIFLATSRGGTDAGALVFVGALFGVMGLCFVGIDVLRFRGELKKQRLRASGLRGTAKVIDVRDTNITVNNSPMVNLDLEVTVPGQSPFRTHRRVVISRLSVGALSPGAVIPVLADARNPKDIVLDWEAGTTAPSTDSASFGPGFNPWLAPARMAILRSGAGGAGGVANAEVLRSVSQALERAADRAEHGDAGITGAADGTTVIDGGTFVTVNGRQVPASEVGATLAGLPGILAAAFGAGAPGATAGAGVSGATAGATAPETTAAPTVARNAELQLTPALSAPATVGAPTSADDPAAQAGGAPIDVPIPGAMAIAQGPPARVSLDTIQDTGVDIAGDRLYAFDLTVSVAGRTPYHVKHAAVVPRAQVARLIQGASFPAQVDPSQPGQIVIAWDR